MGGANLGVAHPSHDVWRITVIGSHSNLTFITGSGSLGRRAVACRFGAETGGLAHHRRLKARVWVYGGPGSRLSPVWTTWDQDGGTVSLSRLFRHSQGNIHLGLRKCGQDNAWPAARVPPGETHVNVLNE